jgi:succinate-semialdehyde dehydrogenase/glutarate-semialdehyde dehydrogenase
MATALPGIRDDSATPAGPVARGEPSGDASGDAPREVAAAVAAARAAQEVWARVPVRVRARALLRLHDAAHARRDELTAAVREATGKSRRDAAAEVLGALTVTRYFGLRAPSLLRPYRRRLTGVAVPLVTEGLVRRVPVGVVANIAAWNYPLLFLLGDTVPAVVAGDAVVLKPDPRSDGVADAVQSLAEAAGLPAGLVGSVRGGSPELGEALVDAVDHVLFTGSTRVGRLVAERAARSLTGVTLELGGKNAAYVAADADLDRAAGALALECFVGAGQTCTSTERVYVAAEVLDAFLERFLPAVRALRPGTGPDAALGPLISEQHLAAVDAHVRDAVARGATVLAGGRARPDVGPTSYEATVLAGVPGDAAVAREETFGPVVSVYPVAGDDEALARMAEVEGGLTAAVWTRDTARGRRLAERVRAGTVLVNETYLMAWISPALPLGGVGASGLGRRFGIDGLREVTRAHVTVVSHSSLPGRALQLPAERVVPALFGAARALRVLRWP